MTYNQAEVSKLVNSLPEIYQPIFGHPELSLKVSRSCSDRLQHFLPLVRAYAAFLNRPIRVLDVGCAQGYYSLSMATEGCSVTGIDFLDANVRICAALAAERGFSNALFFAVSIEDFIDKVELGQFDLVLGLSVFHHIAHARGFDFGLLTGICG